MFISQLIHRDANQTLEGVRTFISSIGPLVHVFNCHYENKDDFGGFPSAIVDIYPTGDDFAIDHKKFGGIFIRIWLYGNPLLITYGLFLGAERAEQSEPRRGVSFTRRKLGEELLNFEATEEFKYQNWSTSNFLWSTKSSRALARQLEQFISFRQIHVNNADEIELEASISKVVHFLDENLKNIKPIKGFGKAIINEYYSENFPVEFNIDSSSGLLTDLIKSIDNNLTSMEVGIRTNKELLLRFAGCLLSKRFLIATGLSGSGKTKIAQAFAHWFSVNAECYELVPVGADWSNNENLLGYPNGLINTDYISKPALALIIHAIANQDTPHFLILDEMNLSHVERYFADILSVIESDETLRLYDGADRTNNEIQIPKNITLPKNLFIIGTVNVDETTYMFSPKVLDRANVIEFRMEAEELEFFLRNPTKPDLSELDGKGVSFGKPFVDAAKTSVNVPLDVKSTYEAEMLLFFRALQAHGAEFGYRTAHDAARFIHFYKLLGNHHDGEISWFNNAFDCVVVQKFLPKLHGSRSKLGPLLKVLWFLSVNDLAGRGADALHAAEGAARTADKRAEPTDIVPSNAPYPMSAEKINRMWRLLKDNGFASFAEA